MSVAIANLFIDVALNIVEEKITISLQQVLDMLTDEIESSLINLILRFDATDYDVCQFEIKGKVTSR